MTAECERNADYMEKASIKYMKVEDNGQKWTIQHTNFGDKLKL
jgi:hypothetical protein